MSGRRLVLLLLLVVAVAAVPAGAGPTAAADVRAAKPPAAVRASDRAPTTTVVQQSEVHDERSAPLTALLVGLGAVIGVIIGLIPALVLGMLLGYLPPPRFRRRADGVLVEPAHAARQDLLGEPVTAPAAAPRTIALAAAEDPPPAEPPPNPLAILAHARHQSVYDAAYADQLERVDELRAAIGGRLREPPEPPSE